MRQSGYNNFEVVASGISLGLLTIAVCGSFDTPIGFVVPCRDEYNTGQHNLYGAGEKPTAIDVRMSQVLALRKPGTKSA